MLVLLGLLFTLMAATTNAMSAEPTQPTIVSYAPPPCDDNDDDQSNNCGPGTSTGSGTRLTYDDDGTQDDEHRASGRAA